MGFTARGALRGVVWCGLILPVLASVVVVFLPQQASAATTNCGRKYTYIAEGDNILRTYFDIYADPNCNPWGNRSKAYDMYATATSPISEIRVFFARDWNCGNLWMSVGETAVYNANWWNRWMGWTPQNTCGYQADIYTRHTQSGAYEHYIYVNVDGQYL